MLLSVRSVEKRDVAKLQKREPKQKKERLCGVMTRYIDKDLLLKDIEESVVFSVRSGVPSPETRGTNKIIDRIKTAPSADVEEVKHGHWIDDIKEICPFNGVFKIKTIVGYRCSVCNRPELRKEPYCNCGAKMDERS